MNSDDIKQFRRIRWLQYVDRWGVMNPANRQSVAEHSFNMIAILRMFQRANWVSTEQMHRIMEKILDHDADEATDGDPPMTTKPMPDFSKMDADRIWLKLADYIEPLFFCCDEIFRGHRSDFEYVRKQYNIRVNLVLTEIVDRMYSYQSKEAKEALVSDMVYEIDSWYTAFSPKIRELMDENTSKCEVEVADCDDPSKTRTMYV